MESALIDERCHKMVNSIVWHMNLHPNVQEDARQAGMLGVVKASHRFDAERGVDFHTYAQHVARGAVLDYLRGQDVVSHPYRTKIKAGEAPEISTAHLSDAFQVRCEDRSPLDEALCSEVHGKIARLPRRDQVLIRALFFGEFSHVQAGRLIGVGGARASQIKKRAIARLRLIYAEQSVKA